MQYDLEEMLQNPWLVSMGSQIIGGIISGYIVYRLTQTENYQSDFHTRDFFKGRPIKPLRIPLRYRLNWKYLIFYIVALSAIVGITLMQDFTTISWFNIVVYVITIAIVTLFILNGFILLDGATLPFQQVKGGIAVVLGSLILPVFGHTKAITWTLFPLVVKASTGLLVVGIFDRVLGLADLAVMIALIIFALVDTIFFAYLFLPRYPEFRNWLDGHYIITDLVEF
ncbi:MAG: hypothetical protein H6657_15300 [Ardenticatenaceae bacterium]|nr:hypothetical protein [Ardenticatenaceae bacterium]